MPAINLGRYPIMDRMAWRTSALVAATAVVKTWDSALRLGWGAPTGFAVTALAITGLWLARHLQREAVLHPDAQEVRQRSMLFGRTISAKVVRTDDAAWVRARRAGNTASAISVEVGTTGYQTTELIRVPHDGGQGEALADMLCARIAAHLDITSKGYKARA